MLNNNGLLVSPLSVDGLVVGFPVACVVGVLSHSVVGGVVVVLLGFGWVGWAVVVS